MDLFKVNLVESRTKEKQRTKILQKSWELFLEKGISETTLIDIANASGVNRRTLYNYYELKEDIAIQLMKNSLIQFKDHANERLSTELDNKENGFEIVKQAIYIYFEECISHPEIMKYWIQFDHRFQEDYQNDEYAKFMKLFMSSLNELKDYIIMGIEDGSIYLEDVNQAYKISIIIIQSIVGSAERIIFREKIYIEEQNFYKEDIKYMVDILVRGLKK